MKNNNYYEILSEGREQHLDKNSTSAEIKQAYRTLMKNSHPDKGGDLEKSKALNEAYEVLSDPVKRLDHDSSLLSEVSPADIFKASFSGRSKYSN